MEFDAALHEGERHSLEFLRPSKKQRTSRDDDKPRRFHDPWNPQKKKKSVQNLALKLQKMRERMREGSNNFEFEVTDLDDSDCICLGEMNPSDDRNQVPPAPDAATNHRHERFENRASIINPYMKPSPRFSREDPVSQELHLAPRFTREEHVSQEPQGTSQYGGMPVYQAGALRVAPPVSKYVDVANGSPKTILKSLRPPPPTPDMVENPTYCKNPENQAAAISQRADVAAHEEEVPNVVDYTDNLSELSNDKYDDDVGNADITSAVSGGKDDGPVVFEAEDESLADGAPDGGVLSSVADDIRNKSLTFAFLLHRGGSHVLLSLVMIIQTVGGFIGVRKSDGHPENGDNKEDTSTLSNDEHDDEHSTSNQEANEASFFKKGLGIIYFFSSEILRKSGPILLVVLRRGGAMVMYCLVLALCILGASAGVGMAMGYLILIGKIDVPAVNEWLGVRGVP